MLIQYECTVLMMKLPPQKIAYEVKSDCIVINSISAQLASVPHVNRI